MISMYLLGFPEKSRINDVNMSCFVLKQRAPPLIYYLDSVRLSVQKHGKGGDQNELSQKSYRILRRYDGYI